MNALDRAFDTALTARLGGDPCCDGCGAHAASLHDDGDTMRCARCVQAAADDAAPVALPAVSRALRIAQLMRLERAKGDAAMADDDAAFGRLSTRSYRLAVAVLRLCNHVGAL